MSIKDLEKIIEDKVMKGEMNTGLYSTGFCFVYVSLDSVNGDTVHFKWFENIQDLCRFIE